MNEYKEHKGEKPDVDALLRLAAKRATGELGLPALLDKIRARIGETEARPRRAPRLRYALIPAAALLAALVAVPALAQTVVVDGERYIALNNRVVIDGVTHELEPEDAAPTLLRIGETNQFAELTASQDDPRVVVFAPGTKFENLKNPHAVPGEDGRAVSLKPAVVYPIVGDLAVRTGPDTSFPQIATLYSGQRVNKVGICGKWAILEYDGAIAYAYDAYLFEAPGEQAVFIPVALYATEPVNVRELPTSRAESAVLAELYTGQAVVCTGAIGSWAQIEWNGKKAYVFGEYLTTDVVSAWLADPAVKLLGPGNIAAIHALDPAGLERALYFGFGALDLEGYYTPPPEMRISIKAMQIADVSLKGELRGFGLHILVYANSQDAAAQLREIAQRKLSPWIPDGPMTYRYQDGSRIVEFCVPGGFPEFTDAQLKYRDAMLKKLGEAYGDYLTYDAAP